MSTVVAVARMASSSIRPQRPHIRSAGALGTETAPGMSVLGVLDDAGSDRATATTRRRRRLVPAVLRSRPGSAATSIRSFGVHDKMSHNAVNVARLNRSGVPTTSR
jgi:hypothetical protein